MKVIQSIALAPMNAFVCENFGQRKPFYPTW